MYTRSSSTELIDKNKNMFCHFSILLFLVIDSLHIVIIWSLTLEDMNNWNNSDIHFDISVGTNGNMEFPLRERKHLCDCVVVGG